jgi:hypothetical protein
VSKLCCPFCWEHLDILRDGKDEFLVRGHHCTAYPLELPAWLPVDVLQKMVLQSRKYLHRELSKMLDSDEDQQRPKGHKRLPSGLTDPGSGSDSEASEPGAPEAPDVYMDGPAQDGLYWGTSSPED